MAIAVRVVRADAAHARRCRASSTRTATPSSARCAAARRVGTSGRGGTGCSRRPSGTPPTPCTRSTRTCTARCARRDTPPWASSTTSALAEARAAASRRGRGRDRLRVPPRRLRARRPRAHAPAVGRRVPRPRSRRCAADGIARRRRPPLRARLSRATGSRRSARYAARERLPLHVHACEQPREIEECLAEHGCRPIELLARTRLPRRRGRRSSTRRTRTVSELDLLASHGATICACPTTEADLGDGFLPVVRVAHRGIPLCIGSDSNVRIDPLEELRELEGIARRQSGRRGVLVHRRPVRGRRRARRARARPRRVGDGLDRDRPRAPLARRRRAGARRARR